MPSARVVRESRIERSPRVMQLEGMFDVPPDAVSREEWTVSIPIEDRKWNIGLIVGPSGCGKSTVARELWPAEYVTGYDWPNTRAVVDGFPAGMGVKEITGLLSSVGFSSPPAWRRPFGVLSNGQQFRVTVARALAESANVVVLDEFTSVVDRTVARIGSAAVAKTVRRADRQLIAVACHYDIIDWLQPDWVYQPADGSFTWRSVQPRPTIECVIRRVDSSAWHLFKSHHYLSSDLNKSAHCYVGFIDGSPAAFNAVISFPHPTAPGWRSHRTVALPDFQGCSVGSRFSDAIASMYAATGKPYSRVTSHPAFCAYLARSPYWRMERAGGMNTKAGSHNGLGNSTATSRLTRSFRYVGPADPDNARLFGLPVPR